MALPIQTAPIDRANRILNATAASRGITPQKIDLGAIIGVACEACSLVPFPGSLICRFVCKAVAGHL